MQFNEEELEFLAYALEPYIKTGLKEIMLKVTPDEVCSAMSIIKKLNLDGTGPLTNKKT